MIYCRKILVIFLNSSFFYSLCLPENFELRADLATGSDLSDFRSTVQQLRDRYLPYHEGIKTWPGDTGMYINVQAPDHHGATFNIQFPSSYSSNTVLEM
jgi:hypothetical protein